MARPAGFEPATYGFVVRHSIQLSYGRIFTVQKFDRYISQTAAYVNDKLKYSLIKTQKTAKPLQMTQHHLQYMKIALEEAEKAGQKDEVPVGAVLVDKNGEVISQAHNQVICHCDPTAHAEIITLRKAAATIQNYRLLDTTLYVTVEPCVMCMGAIIHARVKQVVFGTPDLKWGGAGSLFDLSKDSRMNHKVEVLEGICHAECKSIIQNFFRLKRTKGKS